MPLERGAVEAALTTKGFRKTEGDHTFFIYYSQAGKKSPVRTKTSHGSGHKQISDVLVSQMSKQCKLSNKDFRELVSCTLSQQAYEEKLIEARWVDRPEPEPEGGPTRQ